MDAAIAFHTGTCGNQLTDDDIFLQTAQVVNLTADLSFGANLGGFLDGGCGASCRLLRLQP